MFKTYTSEPGKIRVDASEKMNEGSIMNATSKHQPWADVAVFEDINASRTLETFLRAKGLETRTYDDRIFRRFLFLRPPEVTYRVQVRESYLKSADECMAADTPALVQQALHCPSCGSLHVSYPQMTRKFMLPTVMLHLGILFRVVAHQCYCNNCHFMWELPPKHPRRVHKPIPPFPFRA